MLHGGGWGRLESSNGWGVLRVTWGGWVGCLEHYMRVGGVC